MILLLLKRQVARRISAHSRGAGNFPIDPAMHAVFLLTLEACSVFLVGTPEKARWTLTSALPLPPGVHDVITVHGSREIPRSQLAATQARSPFVAISVFLAAPNSLFSARGVRCPPAPTSQAGPVTRVHRVE